MTTPLRLLNKCNYACGFHVYTKLHKLRETPRSTQKGPLVYEARFRKGCLTLSSLKRRLVRLSDQLTVGLGSVRLWVAHGSLKRILGRIKLNFRLPVRSLFA
ncbi:hypothetical protein MTR_1g051945 [Medicago truncatula]|uniref:Uncharacterized protein n=1 Tax=Medicago truncatula TaxID=3880 RepID=A0A072VHM0_MEDTR|nr:hypothetical protein MTR_1g051945 [Medicago truncatula]